jgi:uncharacterized membrane protein
MTLTTQIQKYQHERIKYICIFTIGGALFTGLGIAAILLPALIAQYTTICEVYATISVIMIIVGGVMSRVISNRIRELEMSIITLEYSDKHQ